MPDGLQTIGEEAFFNCTSLSTVSFPDGLQTIGNHAFFNCTSLSSVSLPNGLQSIGEKAFYCCNSLSSVSLPDGLQTIGEEAFVCSRPLTVYANMKVPIKLKNHPFNDKTMQYGTLYVPVGYRYAYMESEWKSFKDIKEFGTLNIGDLVTEQVAVNVETAGTLRSNIAAIEDKLRITNLKVTGELNVDDIKFIREMAGCYYSVNGDKCIGNLQHLDLSGAKFVSEGKFDVYDGSNYNTAKFTSNAVGDYVFWALEDLKTIVLPNGLKEIGPSAVADCKNLTSVSFPRLLTKIKDSAFAGCSSLTSVSFPKILTEIGGSAFSGCNKLTSITAEMKIPAKIEETTFDTETVLDATLYVPQGCIEKYEAADYWRYFYNIKEIGTTVGVDTVTAHHAAKEVSRYGIDGQQLNGPTKGVNIVKYSDGTTKRVMMK